MDIDFFSARLALPIQTRRKLDTMTPPAERSQDDLDVNLYQLNGPGA